MTCLTHSKCENTSLINLSIHLLPVILPNKLDISSVVVRRSMSLLMRLIHKPNNAFTFSLLFTGI